MSQKIFRSIIVVTMIVLLASLIFTSGFLYDYFNKLQISRLKEELSLAGTGVDRLGVSYFDHYDSDTFRFTVISNDGSVLYDSKAKNADMENHIDRKEIEDALQSGSGSSSRYSTTLTERTFYEALLLSDGTVLRISATQVTIATLFVAMLPMICAIILLSIIIAVVLSQKISKSIVKPLEALDLENPTDNIAYEELSPVLSKLRYQRKQINSQIRELKQRSDEFEQITASMSEGLVLLDKKGKVLSINSAAQKLFSTDVTAIGRDILTLDRSADMWHAVEKALTGKRAEFREEKNGNEYQFIISRIDSDGITVGVVILCIDITETAFAERNRKEFTANVSHELKTPLQSIIGSAELLENGLVKPEDTKLFVGNIKNEATRLVSLINDIIRLSQLDENSESVTEAVDLYEVAKEVTEALTASASKKQVELQLNGESCVIKGIRRYLYEIIYNLCDNAIRYNTAGGKATIDLNNRDGNIILSVSDTGIGIPPEHQGRIFERFYRVDKSHSKETGGTGLGLSIVKHAVAYHGGTIKLDSKIGKGTTVTIEF